MSGEQIINKNTEQAIKRYQKISNKLKELFKELLIDEADKFYELHVEDIKKNDYLALRESALLKKKEYTRSLYEATKERFKKGTWVRQSDPHCYGCKRKLDDQPQKRCDKCHWVKCNNCGKCGCQWLGGDRQ